MLFEPIFTKALTIALALAMYGIALVIRRLNASLIALGLIFLCIGAPLGYDTLMYSFIIMSGGLGHFGPLWSALGFGAFWIDIWWVIHLFTYCLIVFAFAALARRSTWPSLLFVTLISLPGLGFDFLSIMRQGLSTAFVILFYLALQQSRTIKSLSFASLAFLAHPAALFAVVVLIIARYINNITRFTKYIVLGLVILFALPALLPDYFNTQLDNITFLFNYYLLSDYKIESEAGSKLYLSWCFIIILPVLMASVYGRINWISKETAAVMLFLISYGLLLSVSGAAVRLVWLVLPFVMMIVISCLDNSQNRRKIVPFNILFAIACFSVSAYVISIAPEYFWAGAYPHEVYLR